MTDDYTPEHLKLRRFIADQNIGMTADRAYKNPNMVADAEWRCSASHYRCILKRGRKTMTIYFSMGSAHTKAPTAAEVLESLALDASSIENTRGFEDWCAEYEYDSDSWKAKQTYQICRQQTKKLATFLDHEPNDGSTIAEFIYENSRD